MYNVILYRYSFTIENVIHYIYIYTVRFHILLVRHILHTLEAGSWGRSTPKGSSKSCRITSCCEDWMMRSQIATRALAKTILEPIGPIPSDHKIWRAWWDCWPSCIKGRFAGLLLSSSTDGKKTWSCANLGRAEKSEISLHRARAKSMGDCSVCLEAMERGSLLTRRGHGMGSIARMRRWPWIDP